MINEIASRLAETRDPEKVELIEFIRGYSNKDLIKAAQSPKYSSFDYKVRESIFPVFRAQERDIARIILSEKGIDYKIKEKEYSIQKEKTKQKLSGLGNFIKNALTCFTNKK